jgi:hypothetical protein
MLRIGKEDGATDDGLFTEGDRLRGIKATRLTSAWLNAVQEEICNVIEDRLGEGSLGAENNQLLLAIKDLVEYGVRPLEFAIDNDKALPVALPLTFDFTKHKAVSFYSFSQRRTNQQHPVTWAYEHFAVFNSYSRSWDLLTNKMGNVDEQRAQPHTLSINEATGQLRYTTSRMPDPGYEGTLLLSHFRYVRG